MFMIFGIIITIFNVAWYSFLILFMFAHGYASRLEICIHCKIISTFVIVSLF